MRLIKQGKKINNRIIFFGDVKEGKEELFRSLGVEVYKHKSVIKNNDYWPFYREVVNVIGKMTK